MVPTAFYTAGSFGHRCLLNRDCSAFDRVGASIKSSLFQHLERIGVELIGALPASRQQTILF
jgi:predicted permease